MLKCLSSSHAPGAGCFPSRSTLNPMHFWQLSMGLTLPSLAGGQDVRTKSTIICNWVDWFVFVSTCKWFRIATQVFLNTARGKGLNCLKACLFFFSPAKLWRLPTIRKMASPTVLDHMAVLVLLLGLRTFSHLLSHQHPFPACPLPRLHHCRLLWERSVFPGGKGFLYPASELWTRWAGYATCYLFRTGQASREAEKPPLSACEMRLTPKAAKKFGLVSKDAISLFLH